MTQAPDPFDPVEEAQIAQMVNEGGRDKPSDLDNAIQTALDTFKRLNEGGPAQKLIIETDGNHSSARWETPKK